jgi:hypothetical protein
MIEAPNRDPLSTLPPDSFAWSERIRRVPPGTSARSWIIRGVAPIDLPHRHFQNNALSERQRFDENFQRSFHQKERLTSLGRRISVLFSKE